MFEKISTYIKKMDRTMLNGALFSVFSFISRGFGFLLLIILANYISPAEYGYLSLFNTVVMVLGFFMAMSSEGYVSVAYFKEGVDSFKKCVSSILYTTVIVTSVSLVALVVFGESISSALKLPLPILCISVIIATFTVYTNVNLDIFRIKEKIKTYGVLSCSNALLNFIITILLVKYLLTGWEGRIYAQALCFLIFGIIGLGYFFKKSLIVSVDFGYWKKVIIWGIPLIPHLAANFIRQGCDRYIIDYFHSIEDVGLFSFAFNLANIIVMIGSAFGQSISVSLYKTLGDKSLSADTKKTEVFYVFRSNTKVFLGISLLIAISCYFIMPLLVPRYGQSMNYFLILSVYGFLQCIYFLYTNVLFYYNKTKTIMYITFGSSVIHLLLSLLLTRYSLYLTCLIYCIVQIIIAVCIYRLAMRSLKYSKELSI